MTQQYIVVDTVQTLERVHRALRTGDAAAIEAADSVLSALILHLKHQQAPLPTAVQPALDLLIALR